MKRSSLSLPVHGEVIVEAKDVRKQYTLGNTSLVALKGVSLQIRSGEVVAIMGPSGCGKTTLLNCMSGLDRIDDGVIEIAGCALNTLSDNELTSFRAHN